MAENNPTIVEVLVMYKECMRNHAAPGKGPCFDGCGFFVPRGESRSPDDMLCAACNCHLSFHRREDVEIPPQYRSSHSDRHHHRNSGSTIINQEPVSAQSQIATTRCQTPTTSPAPTSSSTTRAQADRAPREAPAPQAASVVRKKRSTRQ